MQIHDWRGPTFFLWFQLFLGDCLDPVPLGEQSHTELSQGQREVSTSFWTYSTGQNKSQAIPSVQGFWERQPPECPARGKILQHEQLGRWCYRWNLAGPVDKVYDSRVHINWVGFLSGRLYPNTQVGLSWQPSSLPQTLSQFLDSQRDELKKMPFPYG